MDGVKISFTLCLIGAIVGEFQAGTQGLGYLLQIGITNLDPELSYAALVVLTVEGLIVYWMIELLGRLLVPWSPSTRAGAG
jgi:NitT/TauT family transport system permease protein